jgi:uncharacterized membrane protein
LAARDFVRGAATWNPDASVRVTVRAGNRCLIHVDGRPCGGGDDPDATSSGIILAPEQDCGIARGELETDFIGRFAVARTARQLRRHPLFLFRGRETHSRSVLKAISWRTIGTVDTFAISWFMTGKLAIAGSIAGLEVVTKVAWYYLHERIWALVSWGRR